MRNHYFIVSYSGGKDSTAMLVYLRKNHYPIDEVIYCRDPFPYGWRIMYKYFKYIEKTLNLKITKLKLPFLKIIDEVGSIPKLPNPYCVHSKIGNIINYIKNKYGSTGITFYVGTRAKESKKRANYIYHEWGMEYPFNKKYCVDYLEEYPIFHLEDPIKFLKENNIEINPLYKKHNVERLSCKVCPKVHWRSIFIPFLEKNKKKVKPRQEKNYIEK